MKALCKQTMGFILMILLACGVTSIKAQDSADDEFITVSGVVKDKQTRKKLEYVISLFREPTWERSPIMTVSSLSK